MKVLSIDVGLVNCSYCLLESSRRDLSASLSCLHQGLCEGSILLQELRLVSFGKKATSFHTLCENVVQFVVGQQALLETVDLCVIEMQMTAKMKAISSALYAALRCLRPSCSVVFQSASAKLSFPDLCSFSEVSGDMALGGSYSQRKRLAVVLARKLLQAPAIDEEHTQLFFSSKKKDDLSDALLHALAALCTNSHPGDLSAPKKRARKAPVESQPGAPSAPKKRGRAPGEPVPEGPRAEVPPAPPKGRQRKAATAPSAP